MRVWGAWSYALFRPRPGFWVSRPCLAHRCSQVYYLNCFNPSRVASMPTSFSSHGSGSEPSHSLDTVMDESSDYQTWTNAQLIARVTKLEQQLRIQNEAHANAVQLQKQLAELEQQLSILPNAASASATIPLHLATSSNQKLKVNREFVPDRYNTRLIALKIAYLGRNYNGFEWHDNNPTPLPTIEEELWKALSKTKLIFPTGREDGVVTWEGCEYSKCGRTDKGVSAFGQVISLRVRSNRPKSPPVQGPATTTNGGNKAYQLGGKHNSRQQDNEPAFDEILDEIEYPKVLNKVLPKDIRVLAWCAHLPPNFSARFSCRERRYRYFFTQPAYAPRAGRGGLSQDDDNRVRRYGWLDIAKMNEAAKYFEGTHDFRNFCKVDPSKQITNYVREIFATNIDEAPSCSGMPLFVERQAYGASTCAGHQFVSHAQVFAFTVHGSAFLWHQVRCMVAILFLVGQGLEEPSIVQELLDVEQNPSKPIYQIAEDAPLVLWDTVYPDESIDPHKDALDWIYPDEQTVRTTLPKSGDGRFGPQGLNEAVWALWRRNKIDEVLAGNLLDVIAVQGGVEPAEATEDGKLEGYLERPGTSHPKVRVYEGGDGPRVKSAYIPLMNRNKMDTVEAQNSRWANSRGLGTPPNTNSSFLDTS